MDHASNDRADLRLRGSQTNVADAVRWSPGPGPMKHFVLYLAAVTALQLLRGSESAGRSGLRT